MTVGNVVFGLIALALWVAVVWRLVAARPVGPLWWATLCVAAAVTTKVGLFADPFNLATGGIYLDVLLGHVFGVLAGTLILGRLARMRGGPDRLLRMLTPAAAVVLVALTASWLLGPVYDIPADSDWVPESVIRSPSIVVHFVVMDVFLVAFAAVFVRLALAVARTQQAGVLRTALRLLVPAATGLALASLLGLAGRVVAVTDGATPPWLYTVQNALLAVVFALFAVAVLVSGSTALWSRAHHPTPA